MTSHSRHKRHKLLVEQDFLKSKHNNPSKYNLDHKVFKHTTRDEVEERINPLLKSTTKRLNLFGDLIPFLCIIKRVYHILKGDISIEL